jgi:hypothetical protein
MRKFWKVPAAKKRPVAKKAAAVKKRPVKRPVAKQPEKRKGKAMAEKSLGDRMPGVDNTLPEEPEEPLTNVEHVSGLAATLKQTANATGNACGSPIGLEEPVFVGLMECAAEYQGAEFHVEEDQNGVKTYVVTAKPGGPIPAEEVEALKVRIKEFVEKMEKLDKIDKLQLAKQVEKLKKLMELGPGVDNALPQPRPDLEHPGHDLPKPPPSKPARPGHELPETPEPKDKRK